MDISPVDWRINSQFNRPTVRNLARSGGFVPTVLAQDLAGEISRDIFPGSDIGRHWGYALARECGMMSLVVGPGLRYGAEIFGPCVKRRTRIPQKISSLPGPRYNSGGHLHRFSITEPPPP